MPRLVPALPALLGCLVACCSGGGQAADAGIDEGADAGTDAFTGDPADVVDHTAPPSCWGCHGRPDHPAPPPDTEGETDETAPGVGAHQAHLQESGWRAPVRCVHCHPVPDRVDAAGHLDTERPADVVFSGLAQAGVAARRERDSCLVSCHGGALHAPRRSPAWTSSTPAGCTSCHGQPPAAPHPQAEDCGACHLEVVDLDGSIVHDALHVDAILQAPGEGHLVHLGGAGGQRYACSECHQGTDYHGPLRDGAPLEETGLCDGCHPPGTMDAASWRQAGW